MILVSQDGQAPYFGRLGDEKKKVGENVCKQEVERENCKTGR